MTPTEKEWHEQRQKCRYQPRCATWAGGNESSYLTCRCDRLAGQVFDEQKAALERQRDAAVSRT
jgi:hypothetical protein